jgi:hypothetical protein
MVKLLELFSGTHSIGKVAHQLDIEVVSLDRDLPDYDKSDKEKKYKSDKHIQCCLLDWNYKKDYKPGDFDIITASPSCYYWSHLRKCWFNAYFNKETRKFSRTKKEGFVLFNQKELDEDIDKFGKPQVDRIIEILEYFKPKWWWIENPKSSSMKYYLLEKGYNHPKIISYCKYGFQYQKHTSFWTNIPLEPKLCKNDCENMVVIGESKLHITNCGNTERINKVKKHLKNIGGIGGGTNRLERYRIPPKLIEELLKLCI